MKTKISNKVEVGLETNANKVSTQYTKKVKQYLYEKKESDLLFMNLSPIHFKFNKNIKNKVNCNKNILTEP